MNAITCDLIGRARDVRRRLMGDPYAERREAELAAERDAKAAEMALQRETAAREAERRRKLETTPAGRARLAAELIAAAHGVDVAALFGPSHRAPVCRARQALMHRLTRLDFNWSTTQIGRFIGRDHSTVVHGIQQHEWREAGGKGMRPSRNPKYRARYRAEQAAAPARRALLLEPAERANHAAQRAAIARRLAEEADLLDNSEAYGENRPQVDYPRQECPRVECRGSTPWRASKPRGEAEASSQGAAWPYAGSSPAGQARAAAPSHDREIGPASAQ